MSTPPVTNPSDYDSFAEEYSSENASSLLNEYYERPAMLALAGDVSGRSVLDAGCGSGPLSSALLHRGASVSGFDLSAEMLKIAATRLGPGVELKVADLALPLPYADNSFDDVIASLVFHYVEDWSGPLSEMRRILRPGGRLILSVNHPLLHPLTHPGADYFKNTLYTDQVEFNGEPAELTYWHRPLHAMSNAFTEAGFVIEKIDEPGYDKSAPDSVVPERLREREAFISFLFFALRSA